MMLVENFLSISNTALPNTPIHREAVEKQPENREQLKHLLIGSPKTVTSTIQALHGLGYAAAGDWSPLQPTGKPSEVMSILIKYFAVK
jgi:hypothetical protein